MPPTSSSLPTGGSQIILAALDLTRAGRATFNQSELVLACWRRSNDLFGLPGFISSYPCSQSVAWRLCGKNGLVKRDLLDRRDGMFSLTEHGLRLAQALESGTVVATKVGGNRGGISATRKLSPVLNATVKLAVSIYQKHRTIPWQNIGWIELFIRSWSPTVSSCMRHITDTYIAELSTGQEVNKEFVRKLDACREDLQTRFRNKLPEDLK